MTIRSKITQSGVKIKNKIISVVGWSILILLSLTYFVAFVYGAYIHVENYPVREITVEDNQLRFRGTTGSSAQAFSGYRYQIKGEEVYIKIRYSIAGRFNKDGDSEISIEDNFENIQRIYLQGQKKDDIRLIWSKATH